MCWIIRKQWHKHAQTIHTRDLPETEIGSKLRVRQMMGSSLEVFVLGGWLIVLVMHQLVIQPKTLRVKLLSCNSFCAQAQWNRRALESNQSLITITRRFCFDGVPLEDVMSRFCPQKNLSTCPIKLLVKKLRIPY